ncbi:MAG: hypothetical protein LBG87_02505 [Spirochaetaceae bacterium]|jgi:hypothetical protein|nr:hypothetical protein [Spirochaetaceae bacterium]
MATIKIFVEGDADVKFLKDYLSYITPDFEITKELIEKTDGWTNINSQEGKGEGIRNRMRQNSDNGGVNLVIFDADKDFTNRKREIEAWRNTYNVTFELFLFPDNQNVGALEDLLEKIIIDTNKPIFDCWNGFEICLQENASKKMDKRLTLPAKKTKIYAYLEVLLGKTKKEKERIKERERDYKNNEHWDLNSEFLISLKEFLLTYIK